MTRWLKRHYITFSYIHEIPILLAILTLFIALDAAIIFVPVSTGQSANELHKVGLEPIAPSTLAREVRDTAHLESSPFFFEGRRAPASEIMETQPKQPPEALALPPLDPGPEFTPVLLGTRRLNQEWQALVRFTDGSEPIWCSVGAKHGDTLVLGIQSQSATLVVSQRALDIHLFSGAE